jgi:hypothetical protein
MPVEFEAAVVWAKIGEEKMEAKNKKLENKKIKINFFANINLF